MKLVCVREHRVRAPPKRSEIVSSLLIETVGKSPTPALFYFLSHFSIYLPHIPLYA